MSETTLWKIGVPDGTVRVDVPAWGLATVHLVTVHLVMETSA